MGYIPAASHPGQRWQTSIRAPREGWHGWGISLVAALLLALVPLPHASNAASGPNTWAPTGSMAVARGAHTATLLPNGQVLVTGGCCNSAGAYANAELYTPTTGKWSTTGSMVTARESHTATLLTNGQVLVAGGAVISCDSNNQCEASTASSAELYNPSTGAFTPTGSLAAARYWHTATLLTNGQVLVAGGVDDNGNALASAELYDPASGTWTSTGSMITARYNHTATLLPNGQVLVAGGYGAAGFLASAELYDPTTGTWTATGAMATPREYHTATLLFNGKVLVAGGCGVVGYPFCLSGLASAELYNPATGSWSATGSMTSPRAQHTATLLSSGKVLVAGGCSVVGYPYCSTILASAEVYNAATGRWTAAGQMSTARYKQTATMLTNGQVLVAGGCCPGAASAELYTSPLLTVQPAGAHIGQTITMTGTAFAPTEPVSLYLDSLSTPPVTTTTDLSGTFVVTTTVPQATYGRHTIIAIGQMAGDVASSPFGVRPALALASSSGAAGSTSLASGYGFGSQETVALYWDSPAGLPLGTATSNSVGTFMGSAAVTITVPLTATAGQHLVYAVGQSSHATTANYFTVQ